MSQFGRGVRVIVAVGFGMTACGCSTKAGTGALVGGAGGAAIGAGVGSMHRSSAGAGALIGGAVGALSGALVGAVMDKHDAEQRRAQEASAGMPVYGPMTKQDVIDWSAR